MNVGLAVCRVNRPRPAGVMGSPRSQTALESRDCPTAPFSSGFGKISGLAIIPLSPLRLRPGNR